MTEVLVVEDDPDVCDMLGRLLEASGVEPILVPDGARALSLLRDGLRPAAIVLDLTMPNVDGWRFRNLQLENAELAAIPTIVITADRRAREEDLAAAAFFRKPFDCAALLDAVLAHVRHAGSAAGSAKQ